MRASYSRCISKSPSEVRRGDRRGIVVTPPMLARRSVGFGATRAMPPYADIGVAVECERRESMTARRSGYLKFDGNTAMIALVMA